MPFKAHSGKTAIRIWKVSEKCKLASQRSSQRIGEEVGDPDLNRRWTKGNFKVESARWVIRRAMTSSPNYSVVRLITLYRPYYHDLFVVASVTFDEKHEVVKRTRRLIESILSFEAKHGQYLAKRSKKVEKNEEMKA
ncbi:hypothetical protein H5410_057480 [Solanum commersonii]|uniref:Uncharacterized protein n=1 Tax=Solanum commersonii TaxID=4109 RepID=A0A9J5WP53_SOLCO|nr:hypothetical protein H5410_057480 [Solanum commersonii]